MNRYIKPASLAFKFAVLLIFLVPVKTTAQISPGFPYLNASNLEGIKVNSERSFSTESLFGYMDGGAELYLEFGFSQLVVSEIEYMGSDFKIEVFKMNGPGEAYGIYSVSFFKCDSRGDVKPFSCSTKYQFQFCKGRYYVNIINNSGSASGLATAKELAGRLSGMIDERSFEPGDYFPGMELNNFSRIVLVRGSLGLYNGASELELLLDGAQDYTAVIAYSGNETYISLKFINATDLSAYLDSLGKGLSLDPGKETEAGEGLFAKLESDIWVILRLKPVN